MSFKKFNFLPEIMSQIEAIGYQKPTPIQEQTIPAILNGQDVMGLAQTGTGKTAAFVLPILERLIKGKPGKIRTLIITPTRELAEQINNEIIKFAKKTNLRSLTVYGGVSSHNQKMSLKQGIDILVACPGRLLDHINQRNIDLSGLETLVFDEADNMFDMGFLPAIKKILTYVPAKRQTLLFSATMPADINNLANRILTKPKTVKVDHEIPLDIISHVVFPVEQHLKTNLLIEILKGTSSKSIIIFTRTKHQAKNLGLKLQKTGYKAVSLQGNLSQNQRQNALDGFRNGHYKIMVATDIAARGIDVSQISHVINYDTPDTTEAYTHRTGRTGRGSNKGEAFSLVTSSDRNFFYRLECKMGTKIPSRVIDGFDYQESRQISDKPRFVRRYR
ncbi:MAG: DEAD/DEAH box helicase [Candidatus Margulisiibacteriota bacterium]|jgi:ATP-dependent RNA helicase RhlE